MDLEQQASPELAKFFDRLLEIKQSILILSELKQDSAIHEIYEKLHDLIKENKKED